MDLIKTRLCICSNVAQNCADIFNFSAMEEAEWKDMGGEGKHG